MCRLIMSDRGPRPTLTEHERVIPFLEDARLNFALMRKVHGRDSGAYARLLRHYRTIADELGCRPALEQAARVPHRRRLRVQRDALSDARARNNSIHRQGYVGDVRAAIGECYTAVFKIVIARRLARTDGVMARLLLEQEAYLSDRATQWKQITLRDLLEGWAAAPLRGALEGQRVDVDAELDQLIAQIAWPRKGGADKGAAGANRCGESAS